MGLSTFPLLNRGVAVEPVTQFYPSNRTQNAFIVFMFIKNSVLVSNNYEQRTLERYPNRTVFHPNTFIRPLANTKDFGFFEMLRNPYVD